MRHPKAHRLPFNDLLCDSCAVPTIVGHAFSEYVCCDCGEPKRWPNTHVPKRCTVCAELNGKCLRCEADMPPFGFGTSPNFPLDNPTTL